ncbi:RSU1 [Bugula neritina]|uniref:RSU1 n=1 Tax=Bugula neritina TaxID=10212 RepID=A0A7J7K0Z8_BUGNE|nr:RSU1 [Bugula neritina]
MSAKAKKLVEECAAEKHKTLDLVDRSISNIIDLPGFLNLQHVTSITLAHNKLSSLPASIANLVNLEVLNLFNNQLEELPTSLSSMPCLKQVLDLTYNNLNEKSLPGNFCQLETLRALYMADNDFEYLPTEIGQLQNLQILVLRDNELVALPKEIGDLIRLRELHIQGNRLTVLPPEFANLDLMGTKNVFKYEGNPWAPPIMEQLKKGLANMFDYIKSDTYKYLYGRRIAADAPPPPRSHDKSKKASRKGMKAKS